MPQRDPPPFGLPVPGGRLARLARIGGLGAGIGTRVLAGGAQRLVSGKRPALGDLLLTPRNLHALADELARMRGAAMKLGQLISMDTGTVLPPDLAAILARLRADATPMPPAQLRQVLDRAWGRGWIGRFARFDLRPIAAASIGQVHRAQTKDGRDLAIKVQYPGVRTSIDSDVANVAALARMSGLLPATLDLAPLLAEARAQLHDEADYLREAAQLARFGALMADDPAFAVPQLHADLTTADVLAMDYIDSTPLEALESAPQALRDRVAGDLIGLALRELFGFGLMQTDPNLANYRWQAATGRIVLLDFGAVRSVSPAVAQAFRALAQAGLANDTAALHAAALALGYFGPDTVAAHQARVLDLMALAMGQLRAGTHDFGDPALAVLMRDQGLAMATDRDFRHLPPPEVLVLHRKFGGLYLLAQRLRARVDLRAALAPHLAGAAGLPRPAHHHDGPTRK